MKALKIAVLLLTAGLVASSCVDHREMRHEIFDENTYMDKSFLTQPNPNHVDENGEPDDYGWLMGLSITKASVPTPVPDLFPGLQSELKYVRFTFTQDKMQIIDSITPGPYGSEGNLIDPKKAADRAPRVLQEYAGNHVDIQLRKNLDGEISNYKEENREREWKKRQYFKTKLNEGAFSDLARLSWYYDWNTSEAMELVSATFLPGSLRYVDTAANESNFEGTVDWEKGDYIEWTVRQTYQVNPAYSSLMNYRSDVDTQTIDIKYSFWRKPQESEDTAYVPRSLDEKDKYRRRFGIWDYTLHNYQDPDTGFIGAKMFLSRFNPRKEVDFYLIDVPKEFETVYDGVEKHTNSLFEEMEVPFRVHFKAPDDGGVVREFGDIRYSFVYWHNNAFSDIPWLGYGPSWIDPRTGETVNATLNFNNWQGLHWYTYAVKDLLEHSSDAFEEGGGSCTPGEMRPILLEKTKEDMQNTTLFSKLVSYMKSEPEEWIVEHSDEWWDYYHMLLGDLRFYYPPYQTFVYSGRESAVAGMRDLREEWMEKDKKFWEITGKLDSKEGPLGVNDFTAKGSIEKALEFVNESKEAMLAHQKLKYDRMVAAGTNAICLIDPDVMLSQVGDISQRCKEDGTWQTFEEWEDDVRWRIAHQTSVHELGHNLGLWHNFYASIDHVHAQTCSGEGDRVYCEKGTKAASSSVMDYVHHFAEVGVDLGWYPYDRAALTYAYRYDTQEAVDLEKDKKFIKLVHPEWHDPEIDGPGETGPDGDKHPERAYLFANDYHRPLSPLVETFDLGRTPTEIVYNAIQYYDWMYKFRNFRSYRQYWETWSYDNSAFSATFPLRRLLEMWALDWNGEDIENDLRLLGLEGDQFFFQNVRDEFTREISQANRLLVNFYRAILTQSNAERSYATTYDSYFGDVTRIGIISDKYYAMMTYLGLWPADLYNQDLYALLAYYENDFGSQAFYSDSVETLKTMLGGEYDVYPWFLPLAISVFAQDTHDISFSDRRVKEWIGFRVFERGEDLVDYFGFDPRKQCWSKTGIVDDCPTAALGAQNQGHQDFFDKDGGQWVYLYLDDRNQHVAASIDMSPISYKMIWDYNEAVNIENRDDVTTYDIKYYMDFYLHFN